jgi:hypothetical protein
MGLISGLVIVTAVLVIIFIIGLITKDEILKPILISGSLIFMFFLIVIGFAGYATSQVKEVKHSLVKVTNVVKSEYVVYVEIGVEKLTFDSKEDYERINDSTTFIKVEKYNHYNQLIEVEYLPKYKVKN